MLIGKKYRWATRSNAWQWAYGMLQNTHCVQLNGLDRCLYVLSLPLFFTSSSSPPALSLFSVVFLSNSSLQLHFLSHHHLWLGSQVRVIDNIHPIHNNPPAWNGCWVLFQRKSVYFFLMGRGCCWATHGKGALIPGNFRKPQIHTHGHHLLAPFFLSFHQSSIHIPIYTSI